MGNLLAVVVHAANIHNTKSGILAARDAFEKYPSIQRFCADAGYRKSFEQDVSRELNLGVDISARIKPEWEVLPKRWIVERSLAWFIPQVFLKITRYLFALLRLFVLLPLFILCSKGFSLLVQLLRYRKDVSIPQRIAYSCLSSSGGKSRFVISVS